MSIDVNTFNNVIPLGEGAGDASMTAREQINSRLTVIQSDLNELVSRISQTTGKSAVVQQYVPLSADAFTGALVYFDTESLVYAPARADLLGIPGSQGQSIEAPCARVEGIVLSKYTDNSNNIVGTILIGGSWQDDIAHGCPILSGALGVNASIPGTYYLSATDAGKATPDPGIHLRQPIISNHGNGAFSVSIFYMAHDNHFHGSVLLGDSWVAVTSDPASLPDGVSAPPTGALYWYDGSGSAYFTGLGELSASVTAIFANGVLEYTDDNFVIADGYLWCKTPNPPAENTVSLFNHYPFAYGSPVLRSVESANSALSVTTYNGRIVLRANDFVSGSISPSAVAISAIAGNQVQFTPVVSGVAEGPGIRLSTDVTGVTTISTSNNIDVPLDAYSIYHKGTNIVCDDAYIYVSFPAGRSSSFVMSLPVKDIPDTTTLKAFAYCCGVGTGGSFNVAFYWTPQPQSGAPTTLNRLPVATSTLSFSGSGDDALTYAETPAYASITGPGQLMAVVAIAATPGQEVRMLRMGFRLEISSATASNANVTNVVNVNAMTNTMAAASTVTQYSCVLAGNGGLAVCTSGDANNVNKCVGIAINGGAAGSDITYLIQGIIENNAFQFTPGAPVFIGSDGGMTQLDPSGDSNAAFIQRVGTALTASIVQVAIEQGVVKE